MAVFKCKMCGGQLEVKTDETVCTCEYCGTEQTLPKLDSEKKTNLYDRANHFRRNNDYDKAMGIYEKILEEDSTDSEAYWSLVLCKYGIEYVEDPKTHKRVPTINRTQYTSIFADENYQSALKNADTLQKSIYENEAKTIDDIQKQILAISAKEEAFDIFICYKESNEKGERTPDSVIANELYYELVKEGYKVFFSKITLEDKLGQEYEPYIFAALNSSEIMIALGTKPEYFNAVWVKNEWSRYLNLISQGAKKTLIPAYKGMDPYDLPEEFSHLQALDMEKLGFMQDLIRGIKKILDAEQKTEVNGNTVVVQQNTGNIDALLKRGNMALEDKEWSKATDFFESVLNQDAECAEAYLGELLAKYNKSNIDELTDYYVEKYAIAKQEVLEACESDVEHIEKIVEEYSVKGYLTGSDIASEYNKYNRTYSSELAFRNEQKERQLNELSEEKLLVRARQYAVVPLKAELEQMHLKIQNVLENRILKAQQDDKKNIDSINKGYINYIEKTDKKINELHKKALDSRESDYQVRVSQIKKARTINDFEECCKLLIQMNGYKDSYQLAKKCQDEKKKIHEQQEKYELRKAELENERIERKRMQRKRVITRCLKSVTVCALVCVVIVNLVIPLFIYNKGKNFEEDGNYEEAYNSFYKAGKIKDAEKKMTDMEVKIISTAEVGDYVKYGKYNENTEWIVLEKDVNRILLLSKFSVESKPFDDEKYNENVPWIKCTLHQWLNEEYINKAFNAYEEKRIYSASDVWGKVFLLSAKDVEKYKNIDDNIFSDESLWWLCTSAGIYSGNGFREYAEMFVGKNGNIDEGGVPYSYNYGVRPAIWVDLNE